METLTAEQPKAQVKLSPPWYTFWNKVKATIGKDPSVTVGQLQTGSTPYVIPITTANAAKAQALANILKPFIHIGSLVINVQVSVPNGQPLKPQTPANPQQLFDMTKTALTGNTLLSSVQKQAIFPGGPDVVWPIFTPSVVQFPNDDLSDFYHNYNGVASDVFKDVLNLNPGGLYLYPSTNKI